RKGWVAWLSVILLLVGLAGGFLVGRTTAPDAVPSQQAVPETVLPSDVAGPLVTKILDDFAVAFNAGDPTRIADFFAGDATLTHTSGWWGTPRPRATQTSRRGLPPGMRTESGSPTAGLPCTTAASSCGPTTCPCCSTGRQT